MKRTDQDFYIYLINESPEPGFTTKEEVIEWIKETYSDYTSGVGCSLYYSKDVKIVVSPRIVVACNQCHRYSELFSLDMIRQKDYNAVTFLQEDKITRILEAQGIRIDN